MRAGVVLRGGIGGSFRILMATQTPAYLSDSVGTGLIESLARPGGNATGFTAYEYSLAGNWLQTLKEIVRTGI